MSDALSNVLEQAEAAAAAQQPTPNTALAQVNPQANALAPMGAPSLEDFANSAGLAVDEFIYVKQTGVRVGSEMKGTIDQIPVIIDMLDITPLYVCRVEVGGNTNFYKSYNGVTTPRGENFQQLVALKERQAGAKSSGIYQSAEIPCTLAEDVSDGKVTVEAGTEVGFTPSLTGFKEFQRFFKQLQKKSPALLQERLRVNLNSKLRTNRNNNEWYVLEFELVGVAED